MSKEELIRQRDKLNEQISTIDPSKVVFSVDANIISRLGKELVGRSETAVSELVKNAYDADANIVKLNFISSNVVGGSLEITDDGHGMTKDQLIKGFMTLSSTSKLIEPISPKYKRRRAGRKGIGRFATQFLGDKLEIVTQTINEDKAIKVVIDWDDYVGDIALSAIENSIGYIAKEQVQGTILRVGNLRQAWTDAKIKRVFSYVSDLLQPAYLSKNSSSLGIANQEDEYFLVECLRTENGLTTPIQNIDKVLFEKALVEIEGFIDGQKNGHFSVKSTIFNIDDTDRISANEKGGSEVSEYKFLKNVHFKVYFFIYDRIEYYKNGLSPKQLGNIEDLSNTQSGVRMYRNGFRVLPYGEIGDDWLGLDRKRRKISFDLEGEDNIKFNIPFVNKNFFGFVEVIDFEGALFEETASREGLIENDGLIELKDFVRKAIVAGIQRISPFIFKEKKKRDERRKDEKSIKDKLASLQSKIDFIASNSDIDTIEEKIEKSQFKKEIQDVLSDIQIDIQDVLSELSMMRILASLGLSIGEFTHEIIQFPIFFNSVLNDLKSKSSDAEIIESVNQLLEKVNHLETYTTYFSDAVSRNSKRDLEIIELRRVVRPFLVSNKWDFEHEAIVVTSEINGYDLYTCPMHPSEWHSILLNLYTNSKKALRKKKPNKKFIHIACGKIDNFVYLEFSDNGIGIPKENEELVFEQFFTTSTPASINASEKDELTGSGLGLKILRDIVSEYHGEIFISTPPEGYVTCFRIEIPAATEEQINNIEN